MIPTNPLAKLRWYATAVGMILLFSVVSVMGFRTWYLEAKVDKLEATTKVLSADVAAASVWIRDHRDLEAKKEKVRVQTEAVLESHPEWSDAPVPDAIADLLRKPASSSK